MPDLPEVTQGFDADTEPYVRGISEAIAAAERFRDMNIEVAASAQIATEALNDEAAAAARVAAANAAAGHAASSTARDFTGLGIIQRDVADSSADLMRQTAMLGGILQALQIIQKNTADSSADLMMQTQLLAGATRFQADAASTAAKNEYLLAMAERMRAKSADDATAATNRGTLAIGRWGLTWNALHWIIAGGAELLAVVIPASIAAAAGAFVMYQGVVEQVIPRLNSLYGATEATGAMIHKTTGDVLGLGHSFQTAQNAANPIAYQLLGSYLAAVKTHMINLAGAGLQVSQALGELAARINVDLINNGGRLQSLLANMVPDLIQLGQVFGNLGHAVLNFASDMPGLAEVLLRIADAISRVILWISQLPPWMITTFMVFEEVSRWGGLVATVFGRLGLATAELGGKFFSLTRYEGILSALFKAIPMLAANAVTGLGNLVAGFGHFGVGAAQAGAKIRNVGEDMGTVISDIPVWQAALAALAIGGFAFLMYKILTAKDATQQWISSTNAAIDAASNMKVIGTIADGVAGAMTKLQVAESQYGAASKIVNTQASQLGREGLNVVAMRASQAAHTVSELTGEQQHLVSQFQNVNQGAALLGKTYGTTFLQSLALADAAGVKLTKGITGQGQAAQIARQQIDNMVQGYRHMDQTGGILGNDMNALAIQAGLQTTKVQQLNGAWDSFLSNATGLTSNFASLITDVGEINNAIATAGSRFTVFGGHVMSSTEAAARSLQGFSGTSAQVWQNYDAALQQAGQFTDSLRTAAAYGAVGQKEFAQQIAYTIQQLLPYARYSKTAASELSVLAQQAGGPATDNYKKLKDWVDKNSESAKQFNEQMSKEVGQISDVSKAASEFASTLDSQVASALNDAKISSANLTGAAANLTTAWQNAHNTVSGPVENAFAGLVTSLFKVYGNTKTAEGIADAYGRSLGMNAGQIKALNAWIDSLIAHLNSIPNINRTININTVYTQSQGGDPFHGRGPTAATGAAYLPAGPTMVGEMGPEIVHLPAGASVTPSWQAAPMMRGGGEGGTLNFGAMINVNVGGSRLQSKIVQQSLTYTRRNPSNNLNLRVR